jgi:hypothetical protein
MRGLGLSGSAVERGWLVIFDQHSNQPEISERTSAKRVGTPAECMVKLIRSKSRQFTI